MTIVLKILPIAAWLVAGALTAISLGSPAHACGSIDLWADTYLQSGAERHLKELMCVSFDYYTIPESDTLLLEVLVVALKSGHRASAQRLFEKYRCIISARDREDYDLVAAQLDSVICPGEQEISRWRTVVVKSANMRARPSIQSERVGYLHQANVVVEIETVGDWTMVEKWSGQKGYVYASLLATYRE